MPKHIRKWLISLMLNFIGLLLSLGLMYVASVVVVLQLSTRATSKNPTFNIIDRESLVIVVGLIAIGLIFRCAGKIYTLITTPPNPD
jgi:hypothetical protein